jgi:hypothetical protein
LSLKEAFFDLLKTTYECSFIVVDVAWLNKTVPEELVTGNGVDNIPRHQSLLGEKEVVLQPLLCMDCKLEKSVWMEHGDLMEGNKSLEVGDPSLGGHFGTICRADAISCFCP